MVLVIKQRNFFINMLIALVWLLSLTWCQFVKADAVSGLLQPLPALGPNGLAVIVNDGDALSRQIGEYYQRARGIPDENIIHVQFAPGYNTLPVAKFLLLKQSVDQQTPKHVQAFALTWMRPYRVGCMSITTAFAAGYDNAFCAIACKPTRSSPYFDSKSRRPYRDYKWRPAMSLAAETFADAKALIDRGIASDYSLPHGTAYLLNTTDRARSARAVLYPAIDNYYAGLWPVKILQQNFIAGRRDVMFYFTGMAHVDKVFSNRFLPGAVADHLTSAGGILSGSKQMSIMEWLKAGATGSYGAVVEPCNYVQKFPNPGVMMHYYLRGQSLIEAYWKSVAWPGQGIFIGEPLAKPFAYRTNPGKAR